METDANAARPIVAGGTGASTASGARSNLGLGSMATQAASAVAITGGTIAGITSATFGVDDTTKGFLHLFGGATEGGELRLYASADDDTNNDYWTVSTNTIEDLEIRDAAGNAYIKLDHSQGQVDFEQGELVVGDAGVKKGYVYLEGAPTGDTEGGVIRFHTADDHDATVDYYQMRASGEDFLLEYGGTDIFSFDFSTLSLDIKTDIRMESGVYIEERAAAEADVAGYGQLWVKNDTPNDLYFTDDTGQDVQLTDNGVAAGAPTKFTSTAQTISAAGLLTLPHGLGAEPFGVTLIAECTSADAGYTVGERIVLHTGMSESAGDRFISVRVDATNVTIRFHNAAGTSFAYYANATTGATAALSTADWELYVKAWA